MDRSGNILDVLRKDKGAQNIRDNISRHQKGGSTSLSPTTKSAINTTSTSAVGSISRHAAISKPPQKTHSVAAAQVENSLVSRTSDDSLRLLTFEDPLSALMGRSLVKNFRGYGSFLGTVIDIDEGSNAVKVQFEDGDTKMVSKRTAIASVNAFLNTFKDIPSCPSKGTKTPRGSEGNGSDMAPSKSKTQESKRQPRQTASRATTGAHGEMASSTVTSSAVTSSTPGHARSPQSTHHRANALGSAPPQTDTASPDPRKRSKRAATARAVAAAKATTEATRTARRRLLSARPPAATPTPTPTHMTSAVGAAEGTGRDQTPEVHPSSSSTANGRGNVMGITLPDARHAEAVVARAADVAGSPSASTAELQQALRGVLEVVRGKELYAKTLESKLKVANEISVLLGQALTAAQ